MVFTETQKSETKEGQGTEFGKERSQLALHKLKKPENCECFQETTLLRLCAGKVNWERARKKAETMKEAEREDRIEWLNLLVQELLNKAAKTAV